MTEYARKAVIDYCGIDLEVYMLPSGGYTLSRTQVAEAIDKTRGAKSFGEFLEGNSPEALLIKGSNFCDIRTQGVGRSIKSTPIKVALAYWSYHAKKGNAKAEALILAGTEDSITRLADQAFGINKSEAQYAVERTTNFEQYEQIFLMFNQAMKRQENMLNQVMKQQEVMLVKHELVLNKLDKQEKELAYLKPLAEDFKLVMPALESMPELKPLLEEISKSIMNNPDQRSEKLAVWLKELGISMSNGKRKSLGRIISDFFKVGNLEPPLKKGCNYYPEAMIPLIDLASKYLV